MKEIIEAIQALKKEKNIAIIAHFYQEPEIQEIADFVGDSLAMAKYGKEAKETTLLICGVQFMAESAKILSPEKMILLSNPDAGCPMADMVDAEALAQYKKDNPDHYIVSYVNTSADVKALSDICVTSSNALNIVSQLEADKILFLPDKNLGGYINEQLPLKQMDLWPGYCYTHNRLRATDVMEMKEQHPDALILAHPECNKDVVALADFVGSTAGIINFAKTSDHTSFIIATEEGVMTRLNADNPNKNFYLASPNLTCKNMKKTSLNDLLHTMKYYDTIINVEETTRSSAVVALDRMLELS